MSSVLDNINFIILSFESGWKPCFSTRYSIKSETACKMILCSLKKSSIASSHLYSNGIISDQPKTRKYSAINPSWKHMHNCDVISMPDKWEFPWVKHIYCWVPPQRGSKGKMVAWGHGDGLWVVLRHCIHPCTLTLAFIPDRHIEFLTVKIAIEGG